MALDAYLLVDGQLFSELSVHQSFNFRAVGHVWAVHKLLLVDIFPQLEVADLDLIQRYPPRAKKSPC